MLNTLKLLMKRFRPKTEIDHKVMAQSIKETEPRNQLVHLPSQHDRVLMNAIRQRANNDLLTSDVSARQRDREFMNKWFNRGEMTNSGSYNIEELQRRLDETARCEEEISIGALPAQEDMLMAFGKPEFDLFEEEKISLSGVFLRVNPNEDFDEQYSMPLLPMYSPDEAANHLIMLEEHASLREEFNLNFSVEETSHVTIPILETSGDAISSEPTVKETVEELTSDELSLPVPVPAFIPVTVAVVDERKMSKIDPSVLFEEWTSDQVFDPTSSETASVSALQHCDLESTGSVSTGVPSDVVSNLPSIETGSTTKNTKPYVKLVAKPNDAYWSESDRLTRFGRRRTSASCSSTRLRALTQSA